METSLRCFHCSIFHNEKNNKIVDLSQKILLDSLCSYLEYNPIKFKKELKYIYWLYYYIPYPLKKRVRLRNSEKKKALFLLKKQNLDGLFKFIFLKKGDFFELNDIHKFYTTWEIIKHFIPNSIKLYNERFLYSPYFEHCIKEKHSLEIYI